MIESKFSACASSVGLVVPTHDAAGEHRDFRRGQAPQAIPFGGSSCRGRTLNSPCWGLGHPSMIVAYATAWNEPSRRVTKPGPRSRPGLVRFGFFLSSDDSSLLRVGRPAAVVVGRREAVPRVCHPGVPCGGGGSTQVGGRVSLCLSQFTGAVKGDLQVNLWGRTTPRTLSGGAGCGFPG